MKYKTLFFSLFIIVAPLLSKEIDGVKIREWETNSERESQRKKHEIQSRIYREDYSKAKLDAKTLRQDSAILPGFSQYKKAQYIKGGLFTISSFGGVLGSYFLYKSAGENHEKYLAATEVDSMDYYWDKTDKAQKNSLIFLSVGIFSWLVNVWDAGHGVDKANQKLLENMLFSYDGETAKFELSFSF